MVKGKMLDYILYSGAEVFARVEDYLESGQQMTIREMKTKFNSGAIWNHLVNWEELGLITREPIDGRSDKVTITEKGKKVGKTIKAIISLCEGSQNGTN